MTAKPGILAMSLGAALLLCGCASTHRVVGSIQGSTYTSKQGGFALAFPVSAEVGGRVLTDDAQSVTFGDNWGSRITVTGLARPGMLVEVQGVAVVD